MRDKIFISHAAPDDNDFTRWLALKLIGLGYNVWCDILQLEKGIDFWKTIEKEIRENSIKFLPALSNLSNQRTGVLNEIATAIKTKKQLQDETFIIPLLIDPHLSTDNINIEIVRLNAIKFYDSWAIGLQDLVQALERQGVKKSSVDFSKSNLLYNQIFLQGKGVIDKDERYVSNWFPILEFPKELRFHLFDRSVPSGFDINTLTFPVVQYKKYLCTFGWEYDFIHQLPKTETYDSQKTIKIFTEEIFAGEYNSDFITSLEAQRLVIQLTNKSVGLKMKSSQLNEYAMSNRMGYWFKKNQIEKDKINKIQMVGKQKGKNWHFGISAAAKLYPYQVLMISSHIFFTEDGNNLIASKSIQHSSRRRQGRGWWNEDWKTKLLAFVSYLTDDEDLFYLEVGSEEKIKVGTSPLEFLSRKSYTIPETNTLEEEDYELDDIYETQEEGEENPSTE